MGADGVSWRSGGFRPHPHLRNWHSACAQRQKRSLFRLCGLEGGSFVPSHMTSFSTPKSCPCNSFRLRVLVVTVLQRLRPGDAASDHVDFSRKEDYLSDADFDRVFGMSRAEFEGTRLGNPPGEWC